MTEASPQGAPNSVLPRGTHSSHSGLDEVGIARTRSDEKSLESGDPATRPKGIRAWWSRRSRRSRWAIVVGSILLVAGIVVAIVLAVVLTRHRNAPVGGAHSGDDTPGRSGKGSSSPPDGPASGYIPNNPPIKPANNVTGSSRRGGKYGYDSVVVLGASYCDNGHLRSKNYSASLTHPPYWGGRHSNGPVWVEYLADVAGPNGTQTQLVDYAYAGAVINNSQTPSTVPDLIGQGQAFLSDLVDGSVDDNTRDGKTLVAIWIGINSVTDVFLDLLKGGSNGNIDHGNAELVADVTTLALVASTVANSTAFAQPPDLLLLPLPPFDELPYISYLSSSYGGNVSVAATFGDVFNDQLAIAIAGLQSHLKEGQQVLTYDIVSWWKAIWADPSAHDFQVSQQACLANGAVCQEPSTYSDWDSLHPTTAAHSQLATVLAESIAQH